MRPSSSRRAERPGRIVLIAALMVLALVAVGTPTPVLAHADLIEASPAPNAVLETSPERVTARFGEPVAEAFSSIEVLDASGERVDAGDLALDEDRRHLTVSLPPLPDGTYTVAWRNVSSVDGHALRSWYVFSVGEPIERAAAGNDDQPRFASPAEPIARWVALLGALALVGGVAFDRALARPALDRLRTDAAARRLKEAHRRWLARLLLGALALWAVGTLLQLPVQLTVATGEPLHRAGFEALGSLLAGTDWGRVWLLRVTLLAVSALLLGRWLAGRCGDTVLWLTTVGALFGMSLASHGATLTALRPLGLSTDFLHLLAASLWVGGLFALFALVRLGREMLPADEARLFLGSLLPRFSVLAVLSVVTLAVTGMVLAWLHVREPAALDSPYGQMLIGKSILFLAMLALGGVNLLWTTREAERGERGARWLGRLVGAEAAVAVVVILAVAAMTSMEPARTAASSAIELVEVAGEVTVTLRIDPGGIGPNHVTVLLEDRRGDPVSAHHVGLRVSRLDAEIGDLVQNARFVAEGHYEAADVLLGMAGRWGVEVVAPRTDGFDVRADFVTPVGTSAGPERGAIPVETARWIWVAQWLALGALFHAVAWRLRHRYRRVTRALTWSGAACLVAVLLVAANVTPFRVEDPVAARILANAEAARSPAAASAERDAGKQGAPTPSPAGR